MKDPVYFIWKFSR